MSVCNLSVWLSGRWPLHQDTMLSLLPFTLSGMSCNKQWKELPGGAR